VWQRLSLVAWVVLIFVLKNALLSGENANTACAQRGIIFSEESLVSAKKTHPNDDSFQDDAAPGATPGTVPGGTANAEADAEVDAAAAGASAGAMPPDAAGDVDAPLPAESEELDMADEIISAVVDVITGAEADEEKAELIAQLDQVQARADEYLDSLQRERAAFQNYRKRVERERVEQAQAIKGDMLLKLLPTLDDFYRAMDAVPNAERDQWFEGVGMILKKFERFLADQGVTEIEALGQPFDPSIHEAVSVDNDSDATPETVTEVLQRGYRQGDRVLRPAMVRVAG
jgi:molecular chaperone GrpE